MDTPTVVDTPDGPGEAAPAPITNKAPEAKGAVERVAPPPPPAPEPEPTPTIPWEQRLDGDSPSDWVEPMAAPTSEPDRTTESAPPTPVEDVDLAIPQATSNEVATGGDLLFPAAYELAAEFGSWLARFSNRITIAALG